MRLILRNLNLIELINGLKTAKASTKRTTLTSNTEKGLFSGLPQTMPNLIRKKGSLQKGGIER